MIRSHVRPGQPMWWWAIAISFVSMMIVAFAGVAYTNYVQEASDRKDAQMRRLSDMRWCALLDTMVEGYRERPPNTDTGKEIAARIVELRDQFGCS